MTYKKFYCSIDQFSVDDFEERVFSYYLNARKKYKDANFVLTIRDNQVTEKALINGAISKLRELGVQPQQIIVTVASSQHHYSTAQWQQMKDLSASLQKRNINFGFEDMHKTWSVEEVEKANSQIISVANELKKKKFSPLEKVLYAYLYITDRKYLNEDSSQHYSESRSVYGALTRDNIVCVGFSEILKAIIDEVGDENIKFYFNDVAISNDNISLSGFHRNLILYIKDDKYGLDGYYYIDPTWDARMDGDKRFNLNYFLVPLSDISEITSHIRAENAELYVLDNDDKNEYQADTIWSNEPEAGLTARRHVSFTSDDFKYSIEFIKDFCHLHPDLARQLVEEGKIYELVYAMDRIDSAKAQLKNLERYQALIDKTKLGRISGQDFKQLQTLALQKHADASTEDRFRAVLEALEKKYLTPELQNETFDKFTQKIKSDAEGCLYWEEMQLDKLKDLSPDLLTDSEFMEGYMVRLHEQEALVATIVKNRARINEVLNSLKEDNYFSSHLPYCLEDFPYEFLHEFLVGEMSEEIFKNEILSKVQDLTLTKPSFDARNAIEETREAINYEIKNTQLAIDFVYSGIVDSYSYSLLLKQYIDSHSKDFQDLLISSSKELDYAMLSRALEVVLKTIYPKCSEKEIWQLIEYIIEANSERAGYNFTSEAINSFAQLSQRKNQHEG